MKGARKNPTEQSSIFNLDALSLLPFFFEIPAAPTKESKSGVAHTVLDFGL